MLKCNCYEDRRKQKAKMQNANEISLKQRMGGWRCKERAWPKTWHRSGSWRTLKRGQRLRVLSFPARKQRCARREKCENRRQWPNFRRRFYAKNESSQNANKHNMLMLVRTMRIWEEKVPKESCIVNVNSNANLNSEWTTLEISRNCDYFRGIQRMTDLWILERGEPKKGNQSEGIPKRGI